MIGRCTIPINQALTLQELEQFMRVHWDTTEYNDFYIGKPTKASIEEYILLPATLNYMVIAYTRSGGLFKMEDKVILTTCHTPQGASASISSGVIQQTSNPFLDVAGTKKTMSLEKERKGPAEEILQKYAAYMQQLLEQAGLVR